VSDTQSPIDRARALLARARDALRSLPRSARILVATTAVAAALILGWLGLRSAFEPWTPLYTQLDRDDAAAIVTKLKEAKVPYRLVQGGTTIEVPEARVHETRLELASAGLPRGGGVGFESFDKMRLGATEFEQRVQYRRALEGELARTIGSLSAVQTARVHLVLPEKSVFVSRSEPASASIVVKLHPGKSLGPSEVAGVVHLTSASVPGLAPERVALVTSDGQMLHRPRRQSDGDPAGALMDADALSMRQTTEANVEERVRAMLERVVGPGHADVRVSMDIDTARVEHVEDHYDPSKTAIRSLDETMERSAEAQTTAGVPGAESNVPQGAALGAQSSVGPGLLRETHTKNFEIDHVTEKRVHAGGQVRRMTVAVILDGVPGPQGGSVPRPHDELERLSRLVFAAAGADAKRGDVVTVDSVPFAEAADVVAPPPPAPPWPAVGSARKVYLSAGAIAAALLVGGLVVGVRRRRRRRLEREAEARQAAILAAVENTPALPHAEPVDAQPALPDARAEAIAIATRDPATAALVLKAWLGPTSQQAEPKAA
jgi:flagellar M-ring protein FliF